MRVRLSEDHAGHTRLDEGFRARAGATHVVTGLERHDGGRATGSLPRLAQGIDFGVRGAGAAMNPLGDCVTFDVEDHTPHPWVGPVGDIHGCGQRDGPPHSLALDCLALDCPALD
jgi:hypothetical protein